MPSISEQRDYYNDRWGKFDFINPFDGERLLAVLRVLVEIRRASEGPLRICDLGCGQGWITSIASTFGLATGVDLSESAERSKWFPKCRFITSDILDWQCPPEEFDVVLSIEVLEHFPYANHKKYLEVAQRILRGGGSLILTTPNRPTMDAIPGGGRAWSNQPVEDWRSARELRHLLIEAGFRVESITSVISGIGSKGVRRILNHPKLRGGLGALRLRSTLERVLLSNLFGLNLVAHCIKK